jgi:hypothetical protein
VVAHDLEGLGGLREGQPDGRGGDFRGASLGAARSRSRVWSTTGTWRQGNWACRPGWLRLVIR